jgi:ribA/ribD-fused uncharacterized protein
MVMMERKMIKQFQNEYRWLSNFSPAEVMFNGVSYASVEHAYMSAKSNDVEWKSFCADRKNSPADVKKASKNIKLRSDWNEVKLEVMEHCVRQKMNQEPYRSKLLATGTIYIQEGNTWKDTFWGVDLRTGEGLNHLGKIIMKVRNELRNQTVIIKNGTH